MTDVRGVSTTLSYVLTLAITALLIAGLITAGGSYVESEREQVIRDQLTVVGQQVAADVERADRLVRAADGTGSVTVSLNQTFVDSVAGATYRISLVPADPAVVVESTDPTVSVTVRLSNRTNIAASTVDGGAVQIRYDDSMTPGELEVRDV